MQPRIGAEIPVREWWAAFMSDDLYVQVIREIEAVKGRQAGHEDVCTERYKSLDQNIGSFRREVGDLKVEVDKVVKAVASGEGKAAKLKDKILYTTISVLFAFACWAAGQIWAHDVMHPSEPEIAIHHRG